MGFDSLIYLFLRHILAQFVHDFLEVILADEIGVVHIKMFKQDPEAVFS
jgi:hypothetical protein